MPVTNMAEAMCLLPPPHKHRPVTRQTPSSFLIAGEATRQTPSSFLIAGEARCLVPSLDPWALSTGLHHLEH